MALGSRPRRRWRLRWQFSPDRTRRLAPARDRIRHSGHGPARRPPHDHDAGGPRRHRKCNRRNRPTAASSQAAFSYDPHSKSPRSNNQEKWSNWPATDDSRPLAQRRSSRKVESLGRRLAGYQFEYRMKRRSTFPSLLREAPGTDSGSAAKRLIDAECRTSRGGPRRSGLAWARRPTSGSSRRPESDETPGGSGSSHPSGSQFRCNPNPSLLNRRTVPQGRDPPCGSSRLDVDRSLAPHVLTRSHLTPLLLSTCASRPSSRAGPAAPGILAFFHSTLHVWHVPCARSDDHVQRGRRTDVATLSRRRRIKLGLTFDPL
jgi:hypothetical protein